MRHNAEQPKTHLPAEAALASKRRKFLPEFTRSTRNSISPIAGLFFLPYP